MIVQLTAERFKRLSAVTIKPDGALVLVTGRNAQGKSSVLDAIEAALGGLRHNPEEPIKRGEKDARVVVQTDAYLVTREWKDGKSRLVVTDPSGRMSHKKPQALLDALYKDIGFDPMEFIRAAPAEQGRTLRALLGLDWGELDARRAKLYDDRKDAGRDLRNLEGAMAELPDLPLDCHPTPEDMSAFRRRHDEATACEYTLAQMTERRRTFEIADGLTRDQITRLEHELAFAKKELATQIERQADLTTQIAHHAQHVAGESPAAVMDAMNAAVKRNEAREAYKRGAKRRGLVDDLKIRVEHLSRDIGAIADEKAKQLADAKMPVAGLGFDDDGGLTYGDVPLAQASQSEQCRVATAVGLAVNPGGIVLIQDGSIFDSDSLREIEALAKAAGGQVWLEKVTDGEAVGVVIEDGGVLEAEQGAPDEADEGAGIEAEQAEAARGRADVSRT